MGEIITRVIDMPYGIKGAIYKDSNDDYNIYINARYPQEVRETAYRHEVEHIEKGHFYDCKTVAEKESEIDL